MEVAKIELSELEEGLWIACRSLLICQTLNDHTVSRAFF